MVTLDNSSYGNKRFDLKKGKPGQESPCYATSSLFAEKELCAYKDWNHEAFKLRRAKLAAWMKERWAIEDFKDASRPAFNEDEDEE